MHLPILCLQSNYPRGDRSLITSAWSFSLLKCRISYTQCGEGGPVARHVTLWRNSGVNIWNKYHTTTHHIPAATCWPNFSGGSLCVILFLLVWNVLISFLPTSSSLWLAAAKQNAELLNFEIDTFGKSHWEQIDFSDPPKGRKGTTPSHILKLSQLMAVCNHHGSSNKHPICYKDVP